MGGLRRRLPRTFPAFFVGALAIAGVPFLSGFFSKDAILTRPSRAATSSSGPSGLLGAVMTAFYMFRLIFLTFFGEERTGRRGPGASPRIAAGDDRSAGRPGRPLGPRRLCRPAGRLRRAGRPPRPLPRRPSWPAAGGPARRRGWNLILVSDDRGRRRALPGLLFLSPLPGYRRPGWPAAGPSSIELLVGKYYVDEIYDAAVVRPLVARLGARLRLVRPRVIDGALNGSAAAVQAAGRGVSRVQTGPSRTMPWPSSWAPSCSSGSSWRGRHERADPERA